MYLLLLLAVCSFFSALGLTPIVRDIALRLGFTDKPDNVRKCHSRPVPRVGGVAILLAYVLGFVILSFSINLQQVIVAKALRSAAGLIVALGLMFLTGLLDDLINLRPWQKLSGELIAACVAIWSGVRIESIGNFVLEPWLAVAITLLWLIGCANAFNLIDGLDGLAAGVGLFATVTTIIAALIFHSYGLAIATVPLAGCLLGFLVYNFNPASIFLGDCGSLSIGFFLACCGVLWTQKSATLLGITAPMIAFAIPLIDTALAILRRFLRRQPIFGGDRRHIHHLLLDRGLTPRRVALLLYGISAVAAILSLLVNTVRNEYSGVIIVLFCGVAWIGVQNLGYSELGVATRVLFRGGFRRLVGDELHLEQFKESVAHAHSIEDFWAAVQAVSKSFGFTHIRLRFGNKVFEDGTPQPAILSIQIRIPLPGQQYLNLTREISHERRAVALETFVQVVQSSFADKAATFEAAVAAYDVGQSKRHLIANA